MRKNNNNKTKWLILKGDKEITFPIGSLEVFYGRNFFNLPSMKNLRNIFEQAAPFSMGMESNLHKFH